MGLINRLQSNPGSNLYNWIFLPGGPGIDSRYLINLIDILDIPGNFWLIDFSFNGDNTTNELNQTDTLNNWGEYFIDTITTLNNPILVAHSFGGYFSLCFSQLEKILKGFIILNSAPLLHSKVSEKEVKENNLPPRDKFINNFISNPTVNTFKELFLK